MTQIDYDTSNPLFDVVIAKILRSDNEIERKIHLILIDITTSLR
jgi:hypothetical protein